MALATVTTKQKTTPIANPKNTSIKTTKIPSKAKSAISSLLDPVVSPYDLLSVRIDGIDKKINSVEKNLLTEIKSTNTRIDATNARIDAVKTELLTEIKSTNTRIDATNARIDAVKTELLTEIKSTNTRIDSLEKSVNRGYVIVGIGIAMVGLITTFGFGFIGFLISKIN